MAKQAGQVAQRALALLNEFASKPESSSDVRADYVWAALAEMYADKFVNAYGDEPTTLWRSAIARLSDEQIKTGFDRLIESGDDWPPTLPAFVETCREKRSSGVRFLGVPVTVAQLEDTLKLSAPRDAGLRDRTLADIRERLKVKAKPIEEGAE